MVLCALQHFPFQGFRDSGIGSQGIKNSLALMVKHKATVINLGACRRVVWCVIFVIVAIGPDVHVLLVWLTVCWCIICRPCILHPGLGSSSSWQQGVTPATGSVTYLPVRLRHSGSDIEARNPVLSSQCFVVPQPCGCMAVPQQLH